MKVITNTPSPLLGEFTPPSLPSPQQSQGHVTGTGQRSRSGWWPHPQPRPFPRRDLSVDALLFLSPARWTLRVEDAETQAGS